MRIRCQSHTAAAIKNRALEAKLDADAMRTRQAATVPELADEDVESTVKIIVHRSWDGNILNAPSELLSHRSGGRDLQADPSDGATEAVGPQGKAKLNSLPSYLAVLE